MPNIDRISQNISQKDKDMIKNINRDSLKQNIADMDLNAAASKMRQLGLTDAANKLDSMSKDDILRQISSNPQILDKLKTLFK